MKNFACHTRLNPLALTLSLACVALLTVVTPAAQAALTVENVTAAQQPGTKLIEITYDVAAGTPTVTVSLVVRDGVTVLPATSLTGDIGAGVAPGVGKTIVWDMGADWNGNVATLTYTVTADDGVAEPPPGMPVGGDPTATSWEVVNERWVKNFYADGAITMSDRTTGLMWVYAPHALPGNAGRMSWHNAMNYCGNLTYAGHADWRLPYVNRQDGPGGPVRPRELEDMPGQRGHFSGTQEAHYWSSSTYDADTGRAWGVFLFNGSVSHNSKGYTRYAWPVRSGQ